MPQKFQAISCDKVATFVNLCSDKKIFTLDEGYRYDLTIQSDGTLVEGNNSPRLYIFGLVYFTIANPYKYDLLIYGFDNGIEYVWDELKGVSQTGEYYVPWCTENTQSFIEIQVGVEPPCEGKCPGYCPGNQICMEGHEIYGCFEPTVPCTECGGVCYGACPLGQTCVIENNTYKCIDCVECSGNCKGPCPEGQECKGPPYSCVLKCTTCSGKCYGTCPQGQECRPILGTPDQYECVSQESECPECLEGEKCVLTDNGYECKAVTPWYKTWWFITLMVLIPVGIILGILIWILFKK